MDIEIDQTKPVNVPGTPPGACPSCNRKFSSVLRPPRRLQKKAKLLIAFGLCLSVLWAALLWIGFQVLANQMDYVIIPINVITGAIAIVVVAAPAYVVGNFAMCFPRVVTLSCRECGWSEQYTVDTNGKIV